MAKRLSLTSDSPCCDAPLFMDEGGDGNECECSKCHTVWSWSIEFTLVHDPEDEVE